MFLSFVINNPMFGNVAFLLDRSSLPVAGTAEDGFFSKASSFKNHGEKSILSAILDIASHTEPSWIVVSRNETLVLDKELMARLELSLQRISRLSDKVILATGGGVDIDGSNLCAFYSAKEPFINLNSETRPISDTMLELYIISAADAVCLINENGFNFDEAFELALIYYGYKHKSKIGMYLPSLAAGVTGYFKTKDASVIGKQLAVLHNLDITDKNIPSLAEPINIIRTTETDSLGRTFPKIQRSLSDNIDIAIDPLIEKVKISIVTRTQFKRTYLLRRLLTSVLRAKIETILIEIILSTDIESPSTHSQYSDIQSEFPDLEIKLVINKRGEHSRVGNMIGGAETAAGDYVWFIDDDDYVDLFAFAKLRRAFFDGNRPFIVGSSIVHSERWDLSNPEYPVLSSSKTTTKYPGSDWHRIFGGVNHIPICAPIIPKNLLLRALSQFEFRFDLSEDYTLFLLLLSSSDLPMIYIINDTLTHISVRDGGDNSVTDLDRTNWTGNIVNYLYDLLYNDATKQIRCWPTIFNRKFFAVGGNDNRSAQNIEAELDRLHRLNQNLLIENAHLRRLTYSSMGLSLDISELRPISTGLAHGSAEN